MLGVIYSLKEKGLRISAVIICDRKYVFLTKCKYLDDSIVVGNNEKEILNAIECIRRKNTKPLLIPTSDMAAFVMDKHLNELRKKFILQSLDDCEGAIVNLMNKYNQNRWLIKYNLPLIHTEQISLSDKDEQKELFLNKKDKFPVIIKPSISAEGDKDDIAICKNEDEFKKTLQKLVQKKYSKCIVQKFIKYDEEIGVIGCVLGETVVMPGVVTKIRLCPTSKGSTSLAEVTPAQLYKNRNLDKTVSRLFDVLKKNKYNGLFDIELFRVGDKFYINEINFRNSGISYTLTAAGANFIYLWVKYNLGIEISDEEKNKLILKEKYRFRDEIRECKLLRNGEISLMEWWRAKKTAITGVNINIKTVMRRYAYSIANKINDFFKK